MDARERATIRRRYIGVGTLAYLSILGSAAYAKVAVPQLSWSILAIPLVFVLVIGMPTLYFVSSLAVRLEEYRRTRTRCAHCGQELSRAGAFWCRACQRLTKDGSSAIISWLVAISIIVLFWYVSGRLV